MREGATNGSDKSHAEGVFDWTQSGQSGAWGDPNQRFRNIQKDIPKTLLAYVSGAFGSLNSYISLRSSFLALHYVYYGAILL